MRNIAAIILTVIALFAMPMEALAAVYIGPEQAPAAIPNPGREVTRNDHINQQQFSQIYSTLQRMKECTGNGNYDFCDTGVRCGSCDEAKKIIEGFEELFLADNGFVLYYNEQGWKQIRMEPTKNANGKYSYRLSGTGGEKGAIYAVWKPDVNANEMLRQHEEAKKVIDALLAAAPADAYEKMKYFNDALSDRITYDMAGYVSGNTKHSPYYGLVEGSAVCTGYAESFFNLCYYSGISCAVSDCVTVYSTTGAPDHKISMVNLDGRWKEVDVTWNDTAQGINYNYFMVDLNDAWQNYINGI